MSVPGTREGMASYLWAILARSRDFLDDIQSGEADTKLNAFTPAPWGEMRPTYLNLWGGIIEHTLQHAAQISARLELIRQEI